MASLPLSPALHVLRYLTVLFVDLDPQGFADVKSVEMAKEQSILDEIRNTGTAFP